MKENVERLFPFARRARITVVGRPQLLRMQRRLQFLLITEDLSANSLAEVRKEFTHVPIIQCYRSTDVATFFGFHNTKIIGFQKSSLAMSIFRELKGRQLPVSPRDADGAE